MGQRLRPQAGPRPLGWVHGQRLGWVLWQGCRLARLCAVRWEGGGVLRRGWLEAWLRPLARGVPAMLGVGRDRKRACGQRLQRLPLLQLPLPLHQQLLKQLLLTCAEQTVFSLPRGCRALLLGLRGGLGLPGT